MNRASPRFVLAGAIMLLAQLAPQCAHAQYSWIAPNGTRVFSDRPPPPGTPPSRILKAPQRADAALDDAAPAAATDAASTPAGKPKPPSLADREADFRKRQAEREADEKKAQDAAAKQAAQQEICASARQEEAQLASGVRITEVEANGERGYISDEERARRLGRARQALASCR
jgi:hypothetical protein